MRLSVTVSESISKRFRFPAGTAFIIHSVIHELTMSLKSTYICLSLRELINIKHWFELGRAFLQIARLVTIRSRKSAICVTANRVRGETRKKIARTYVFWMNGDADWENRCSAFLFSGLRKNSTFLGIEREWRVYAAARPAFQSGGTRRKRNGEEST